MSSLAPPRRPFKSPCPAEAGGSTAHRPRNGGRPSARALRSHHDYVSQQAPREREESFPACSAAASSAPHWLRSGLAPPPRAPRVSGGRRGTGAAGRRRRGPGGWRALGAGGDGTGGRAAAPPGGAAGEYRHRARLRACRGRLQGGGGSGLQDVQVAARGEAAVSGRWPRGWARSAPGSGLGVRRSRGALAGSAARAG